MDLVDVVRTTSIVYERKGVILRRTFIRTPFIPVSYTHLDVYKRQTYSSIARNRIKLIEKMGITHYPVCIAKTQYSFSADPKRCV